MARKKASKIHQYIDKEILLVILIILIVQLLVTYFYTNTKEFSKRAFIRNLVFGLSIYFTVITKNLLFLLIPFVFEFLLEFLKLKGLHIEKYIATKYQYNDYWREINKNNSIFSNFSEGNYDRILGFDTTDHSEKNMLKILKWSRNVYKKSLNDNILYITDINGNKHEGEKLKKITDYNKFKLISETCKLKPNMRILEIGFGEGDFMNYIKKHYKIDPVGVSISQEQVDLVKKRGFEAYCMNSWNMTREKLGTFDLIIQCGNLEYIKCTGESDKIYENFSKIIYSLLNKNGKYFITCIHLNERFNRNSLNDNINCYLLWSGNDGQYPYGRDGFTKHAQKVGFKKIYQQDRTHDYFITTVVFMSYLQCMGGKCTNSISFKGLVKSFIKTIAGPYYLHTYLCYSPTKNFDWLPWQWEFIPQKVNNRWITPVTLEYILLQK